MGERWLALNNTNVNHVDTICSHFLLILFAKKNVTIIEIGESKLL